MPLRNRNLIQQPSVFFLTTSTYDRKPFPEYPNSLAVIEFLLFQVAQFKSVSIMGYVIMPNHIHLIAGLKEGGSGIAKFMHSLKGMVRKELVGNIKLWQDRFDDLVLTSEEQFNIKLDYIHNNPVKSGLVTRPGDWPYSSYKDWLEQSKQSRVIFDFSFLD